MSTNQRVPTVNDLRVKLCYICREEELTGAPQDGLPRAWTHPCKCTLMAHEQCLLKWIQSSQGNASRAPNALKCPQCGVQYEMESKNPVILRLFAVGNKVLQRLGRYFTVFATAAAVGIVGTSVYVCLTAYGAWAVQKFLGKDFFNLVITDDPANWSWSCYVNFAIIPIGLVLSRFQTSSHYNSVIVPLLLSWPMQWPVGEGRRRLLDFWSKPENARHLPLLMSQPGRLWPPSPWIAGLLAFPILRALYERCFASLYLKLMGTPMPSPRRMPRGGLRFNEGPFVIRIRANIIDENGNEVQEEQAQPRQNGVDDNADQADQINNQDPNAAAAEAAEQLIEINASSLGRRVAGALIMPAISSFMGNLLYRVAMHPTFGVAFLRTFLGIRSQPRVRMPLPSWDLVPFIPIPSLSRTPGFEQKSLDVTLARGLSSVWSGTPTWLDSDPVWWRNAIGFGAFIIIKDCVHLLHLWLAKRELESRRVKNRDFKEVDIRELDLLPSFFQSSDHRRSFP